MFPHTLNREEIISQIERAFRRVERPGITLRVARGIDDNRLDELPRLEREDDHYRNWSSIPNEDITKFWDVFPWLCPVGFRFYLPAYMTHSLRTSSRLIDELWLRSAFGDALFRDGNMEALDEAQIDATLNFLTAAFLSIPDDYHRDWWNYPWDKDWADDAEKEQVWRTFGGAFCSLKKKRDRQS